jgi:hypothetical protein
MSEEFTEENITGEIIEDDEREGVRRRQPSRSFNIFRGSIFDFGAIRRRAEEARRAAERAAQEARQRIEREQREREQRARDAAARLVNLENQVRQLTAYVSQLETKIRDKDLLINKKNRHIAFLTKENTRLRKKVNSLLDNLQYYRTLVLGNKEVDGYQKTVIKQQIKNDELIQQEIGKPILSNKTEGFSNIYEYYENLQEDFTNLQNEYKVLEGYVDSTTSSYNAVFTENQAVKNQIDSNTNEFSVDNQLSLNIIAKTNNLKYINFILICIFLIVYVYGCYKIYKVEGINLAVKVVIIFVMFLSIFILHLIEYIIFNSLPYVSALLIGTPYNPPYYWKKPGIYDYLPTP